MAVYPAQEVLMEYDEFIMSGMGGIANIVEKYLIERDGE